MPPAFPYAEMDAQSFVDEARHAVCEIHLKGVRFSASFVGLPQDADYTMDPASDDGE